MNKYSLKAYNYAKGRWRFYSTTSVIKLMEKIKELKELGYSVEVK